jgi:hypothetical protein
MKRAAKAAAVFGAYVLGYHIGYVEGRVAGWRGEGVRRVG